MGKLLYHYCSYDTFVKILGNPRLRFTDITKSDDKYEIIYLWNSYVDYIKRHSNNEIGKKLLEYEIQNQYKNTVHLTTCFSEKSDSLLLWKLYASGGISIGFDKNYLVELSKKITVFNNCVSVYEDEGSENNPICSIDKVQYRSRRKIKEYASSKCDGMEFIISSFGDFFKDAPFYKTDFWKDEKEWRMVINFIQAPEQADFSVLDSDIILPKNVEMHSEDNRDFKSVLSCYVPFDMKAIRAIIIAPNSDVTIKAIKILLKANGFSGKGITVKKSLGGLR